jgi:acyl-CoA thioesterase
LHICRPAHRQVITSSTCCQNSKLLLLLLLLLVRPQQPLPHSRDLPANSGPPEGLMTAAAIHTCYMQQQLLLLYLLKFVLCWLQFD